MGGGLFLMLEKNDLNRLESHWAIAAIPKTDRKACFNIIEKINVQKSIKKSIQFNFKIEKDWQEKVLKMALAYEMPAIENIASFTNYADESCDRGLFSASAWRCFDLYSVVEIPKNINQKEGLIPRSLLRNKLFQDMEEEIY